MDRKTLEEVIEAFVNPKLQEHNGWIETTDWDGKVLTVRFRGACAGCDGIWRTLDALVMPAVQQHAPAVEEIRLEEDVSPELYTLAHSLLSKK